MDKFLDLAKRSVIVQGILTIMVWGAAIYMYINNIHVPDLLAGACGLTISFYFVNKYNDKKSE